MFLTPGSRAKTHTAKTVNYTSQTLTSAQQTLGRTNISAALKGRIFGLTLANNGGNPNTQVDIAIGECASTETNPVLMVLASSLTKKLDAVWAVGTTNGGLDTGTKSVSTWYYVWLIRRSDTGVVDALFSLSSTAPTMPTNYDQKRRIGAVRNDGSSNILAFKQSGDEFLYVTPVGDISGSSQGTTAGLYTLTVPPIVGVKANFNSVIVFTGTPDVMVFTSPDQADLAPSAVAGSSNFSGTASETGARGFRQIRPVSGQIRVRAGATTVTVYAATIGWTDDRGIYGGP